MKTLKSLLAGIVSAAAAFIPQLLQANPLGESVVAGQASFDRSAPGVLSIQQGTDRAIINWQDFSIGANELTRFLQPGANSAVLNRVITGNPSSIFGNLQANGQVYLLNPAGILVGPGGQIDTRGFVASTLNLSDESFLKNAKLTLSGDSDASVKNLGRIQASQGNIYLISRTVENAGSISAPNGTVGLGAGTEVILGDDQGGIAVRFGNGASVVNSGTIEAATAELKAAGGNVYALAINNSGIIRATTVANEGGKIVLKAESGTTLSSGTLDASGTVGGSVQVLGDRVGLVGQAVVDASGVNGGGEVLVGGDYKGGNAAIKNAQQTLVGSNAKITVDALTVGNGGRTIVWADEFTQFYGSISGKGGAQGGNGGFAEVSGKNDLDFQGSAILSSALGLGGNLLLDPKNITVVTGGTATLAQTDEFGDSSSSNRSIDPGTITTALNASTSVTLQANNDITISNDINVTGGTANLTMQAGRQITMNANISIRGAFTATANDGASTSAQRDSGLGGFTMAVGTSVDTTDAGANAAGANVTITIAEEDGGSEDGGDITLAGITAGTSGHVLIQVTDNDDTGPDILRASGAQLITASSVAFKLDTSVNTAGSIGTAVAPIRISVSNVEASGTGGGVHLDSTPAAAVNIGGASLGGITGITTANSGNFSFTTANQAITDSETITIGGTTTLTTGTGDITLNSSANNFSGAISIVSADDVNLVDASAIDLGASTITTSLTLTLTAGNLTDSGPVSVGGNSSFTLNGANADVTLDAANTFTGTVSFSGASLSDITINDTTALAIPALTLSGNLSVTAPGITQSGALSITGTTTLSAGASQDITLDTASNNFVAAVTISSADDVTITDGTGTLDFGASSISGNLTATASGAITDSGVITANGASKTATFAAGAANNITLDGSGAGSDFTTVAITTGNNVSIEDPNALNLGASTVSGTLTVETTGDLTDSGAIVVTGVTTLDANGSDVTLDHASNNFSTVTHAAADQIDDLTLVDSGAIILGALEITGNLSVTSSGAITQSGTLTIDQANKTATFSAGTANDITLTTGANNFLTVIFPTADDVSVTDAGALIIGTSNISGDFTVSTTGAITQSGIITANGSGKTASFASGGANAITLNTVGNDFTTFTFSNLGAAVQVTDASGLDLGASTTTGDLTVIVSAGDLSDSGVVSVVGNTILTGSTAANLILDQANTFTGTVTLNPATGLNNVTLRDTTALVLGQGADLNISGDLNVTVSAGANISQANDLIVNGSGKTATFTTSGAGTIDLTTNGAANNFATLSLNAASTVTATDANDVILGASTVSGVGNLTIISTAGSMSNSGALTFSTTGGITLTVAAGQSIVLDNAANAFAGTANRPTLPASVLNLTLVDTNGDLDIESVTVTGALDLKVTGGDLSDSGTILVTGNTTLTATGAGNTITLDQAANDFGTVIITSVDDVTLVDTDDIVFGATTITTGGLTVTATNGSITDTGTMVVNGLGETAFFTATGNFAITLDSANNDFSTIRVVNGGATAVSVTDVDDVDLGISNVGAALTINAGGDITDSGTVTIAGLATFATTGNNSDINLGTLAITAATPNIDLATTGSTGDATIVNTVAVDFAASSIGGNLSATATSGNLTDTGIVTVGGNATFITSNAGDDILMNQVAVTGSIGVTTTGAGDATILNATGVDLSTSTVGGILTVDATTGNITDSGVVTVTGVADFETVVAGADIDLGTLAVTGAIRLITQETAGAKDASATIVNSTAATDLGVSSVEGDLSVTASGATGITDSAVVTVTGDATFATSNAGADISLGTLAITGAVILTTTGANGDAAIVNATALTLGESTVNGTLGATATLGGITGNNALTVTGAATFTTTQANQDTSVNNSFNNFGGTVTFAGTTPVNVTVYDSTAIDLAVLTVTGNLTVTSDGAISESGVLTVGGTATFTTTGAGDTINVGTQANNFATIVINSVDSATVQDAGAIIFGGVTITGGNLTVDAAGAITDSGPTVVSGTADFDAGAFAITLDEANNNFATFQVTDATATGITVVDKNAIILAATTITTGNLSVTSSGAITQSAAVVVGTGTATFAAGNSFDITLTSANDFDAIAVTSGKNVQITHGGAAVLDVAAAGITVSGNLTITTGGQNLTDTGAITMNGPGTTFTIVAGAGDVILNTVTSDYKTVVVTSGDDVTLDDDNTLILGTSAVAGILTVNADDGMTDSGTVTVTGDAVLTTSSANGDIVLDNLAVNGGGADNFTITTAGAGADATIVNTTAVDLAASTVVGNLSVTATAGNITDGGAALAVTGNATFTTSTSNDDITLTGLQVTGSISVNTLGATGNAAITESNGLDFGASNVGGTLAAVATLGDITDTGAVVVAGATTLTTAAAANITLNSAANNFIGTLTLPNQSLTSLTLVDTSALDLIDGGGDTMTVTGAINITAPTITQSDEIINSAGTATFAATSAFDVTLSNAANNFGTVVITSAKDVSITDINAVILGASTISGNLTVNTSAGNGNITQTGIISAGTAATFATFNAGTGDIDLNDFANNFATVVITAAGDVDLQDSGALILGTSAIGEDLTVSAGGNITDIGTVTVTVDASFTTTATGADITLDQLAVNGGATDNITVTTTGSTSDVTIVNTTAIDLAASTVGGNLTVTATAGNITDGGAAIAVGGNATFTTSTSNDDITLSGLSVTGTVAVNTTGTTGNATITEASSLDLATTGVGGTLTATSTTGNLTDSGTVTVGVAALFITTAANADIDLGTLAVAAGANNIDLATSGATGNATIVNSATIDFATSAVGGNLTATSSSGDITDTGGVTVGGTASFTTSSGNDITLDVPINITGAISLSATGAGANATINNANDVILASVDVDGNLTITTGGTSITDTGTIDVAGNSDFTLGAGAGSIVLNSSANVFTGTVDLNGTIANATIVDTTAFDVHTSGITATGNLSITAGGAVTQTGALDIDGTTTVTATGLAVTLSNASNDFTGAVSVTGLNVALVDANSIDLGASTVTGTYAVTATAAGDITDSGTLAITGAATFTVAGGRDITLNSAANSFANTVTFAPSSSVLSDVTIVDTTAFDVQTAGLTLSGNLSITAGAAVTQTGPLTITGTTTVSASGFAVTLANTSNDFTGAVSVTGAATQLVDANAIDIGASTISSTLAVTTTGTITDSGAITVVGTTTLTAPGSTITLDNNNNFTGAVTVTDGAVDAANVTLTDINGLILGASAVSANLTLNTTASSGNGDITQTGALSVGGTLAVTAGTGDVTLTTAGNTLNQITVTSADDVSITDLSGGVVITGASAIAGDLTLTVTAGDITDAAAATLTVAGDTTIAANGTAVMIILDSGAANYTFTGDVTITSTGTIDDVTLTDTTAFALNALDIIGDLTLTAAGITDEGNVEVDGNLTLTTTGTSDIVIDSEDSDAVALSHDWTGTLSLTATGAGADASITYDGGALVLGTVSVSNGNLTIDVDDANLTDSGTITVNGASKSATIDVGTGSVTLNSAANDFTTLAVTAGADATIVDVDDLDLGTSTLSGDLTITATSLTDSGALSVGDDSSLTVTGDITLNNSNTFTGDVTFAGGPDNVTIVDTTAIDLATLSTGVLSVTGAGITQSGAVTTTGNATFVSTGAGNDAVLSNTSNSFGSAVILTSADDATVADSTDLDLGTASISGNLTASSAGAAGITDSGTLTVAGTASFTTSANNADLSLGTLAVTGQVTATTTSTADTGDVALGSAIDLTIATASVIDGDLTVTMSSTGKLLLVAGTVTASDDISITGPVQVNGNATVTSSADGDITFNNTINSSSGAENLTVNTGGVTTFAGVVGATQKIATLSTDADGAGGEKTSISAASVKATVLDLNDAVEIAGDTTLIGTTSIDFATTVDSVVAAKDLTLTSPTIGINGKIGDTNPLDTLTTTTETGTSTIATDEINAATVDFNDSVVLSQATTTITATTAATFEGIDGSATGKTLTVTTPLATFSGDVGASTPLDTLSSTGAATVFENGLIELDNDMTITGTLTLKSDVIVNADDDVTFTSTIDADSASLNRKLTVNTPGTVTFSGLIGDTAALGKLKTDDGTGGDNTVFGTGVTTVEATTVELNDAVTFDDNLVITATDVTFGGTLDAVTTETITVTASGVTTFGGVVGGNAEPDSITTSAAGTTVLKANVFADAVTFADDVVIGGNITIDVETGATPTVTFGASGTGKRVDADLSANSRTLTIAHAAGTTTFYGKIGAGPDGTPNNDDDGALGTLTTDTTGTTAVNGGTVVANTLSIQGPTTLGAHTTVYATTFTTGATGTIDGDTSGTAALATAKDLTITATGVTTIGAAISDVKNLTINGEGTASFSATASTITTFANQVYTDPITLAANVTMTGKDITVGAVTGGGNDLTLAGTGLTTLGGAFTTVDDLAVDGSGATASTIITTTALTTATSQTYSDPLKMGANVTLTSPTLTFTGTINADAASNNRTLTTVSTTGATFSGVVGGTAKLASLTVSDSTGTTTIGANMTASAMTFNDPVLVSANSTLTASNGAGGDITFADTLGSAVDGSNTLTVNASGTITFNGDIGNAGAADLATLTTSATTGSDTVIQTGAIASTTMSFQNAVTLGEDVTFTGTTISFGSTLNPTLGTAGVDLDIVSGGVTTFTGVVGGVTTFNSIESDATGTTTIKANANANSMDFNDDVKVGGNATLTASGNITFDGAVNGTTAGAQELTVNSDSTTTFTGAVGSTITLKKLETSANGSTVIVGGVVKATTLTLQDEVTLSANTTTTGTTATFGDTVDGAFTLTVTASGNTTFKGDVGDTTPLTALTTDAAGTTIFFATGGDFEVAGAVTFNDKITLQTDSTVTATGGANVTFANTINGTTAGTESLTVTSSGVTAFNGIVGALIRLEDLVTDAAGSTQLKVNATVDDELTFNDAVSLTGNSTVTADGGIVRFQEAVTGSTASTRELTFGTNTEGHLEDTVGTALSPLKKLASNTGGTLYIKGGSVRAVTQAYTGDTILEANTTLTGTTVTFTGDLDADVEAAYRLLTITASGVTTLGAVGTTEALGEITTDSTGTTKLAGDIDATGVTFMDAVTLSDTATDTVQIDATTVLFNSTLNGTAADIQSLTVNASGTTTFNAAVGGTAKLLALTTDNGAGADSTTIKAAVTASTQTYGDAVVIGANAVLTGSTAVTFSGTVDGDLGNTRDLTINGGDVTLAGVVGGTQSLKSLKTDASGTAAGTTTISGGAITATTQTYNDASGITLGANTTLTGTTLTLNAVTGATFNLTLSGSGTTKLTGDISGVGTLLSNNGGTTEFGLVAGAVPVAITTTGTQTYSDNVVLRQNTTLTGNLTPTISGTTTLNGKTLTLAP